tara:strand:+ start:208 stop:765 length:558 start_codon:yes stop_codon:yes gene_type:complete
LCNKGEKMKYYEILYAVHPALESGRLKDIILSIQKIFEDMDVKILSTDVWGKKKLAYLIEKQQYGTYVLVQFQSDGQVNQKISTELEHNPNILTYLISKIDESDIQKDSKSLDEQIIGRVDQSQDKEAAPAVSEEVSKEEAEAASEEVSKEEAEAASEEVSEEEAEAASEESSDSNNEELTNEEK